MDEPEVGRERREAPHAPRARLAAGRTADRGARLRVLGLIAFALAIVGAGAYGRLEARRDSTAAVATVVPVASFAVAATASPDRNGGEDAMRRPRRAAAPVAAATGGGGMTLGEDGLIGGAVPRSPVRRPLTTAVASGTVCAVLRIQPDITVVGHVGRGMDGVYRGTIPVRAPRRPVTATLELFLGQSESAFQGRSKVGQASLGRFEVRVDARPFPAGTLPVLRGSIAPRWHPPSAVPFVRTGARVTASLVSDGRTVQLAVAIAALSDVAELPSATVEVHAALAAAPSIGC